MFAFPLPSYEFREYKKLKIYIHIYIIEKNLNFNKMSKCNQK